MNIDAILQPSIHSLEAVKAGKKTDGAAAEFSSALTGALESLSQSQLESDRLLEKLAAGEEVDIHQVMIAAEETDIQFRIAVGIRDKLVDAYREIMRMAV